MVPILLNKLNYVQLVKKSTVLIWNRNQLGVRIPSPALYKIPQHCSLYLVKGLLDARAANELKGRPLSAVRLLIQYNTDTMNIARLRPSSEI